APARNSPKSASERPLTRSPGAADMARPQSQPHFQIGPGPGSAAIMCAPRGSGHLGKVAEPADAQDLGSCGETRESSSLSFPTRRDYSWDHALEDRYRPGCGCTRTG